MSGAGTSASVLADILRTLQRALLSGALQACSTPLLKKHSKPKSEVEPLGTGVGTHTVPLCGARATDLNSYLKSLRKKERNTERAALRGQERKVGVEKSEYLALDWGRETSLKSNLKSLRESPRNDQKRKKESGGQGGVCTCVCPCVCVYEYLAL